MQNSVTAWLSRRRGPTLRPGPKVKNAIIKSVTVGLSITVTVSQSRILGSGHQHRGPVPLPPAAARCKSHRNSLGNVTCYLHFFATGPARRCTGKVADSNGFSY